MEISVRFRCRVRYHHCFLGVLTIVTLCTPSDASGDNVWRGMSESQNLPPTGRQFDASVKRPERSSLSPASDTRSMNAARLQRNDSVGGESDWVLLPHEWTSRTSGYVTSPECHVYKVSLCDRNQFFTISVLEHQVTMISFPLFDPRWSWYSVDQGNVSLSAVYRNNSAHTLWEYSSKRHIDPRIYRTSITIRLVMPLNDVLLRGFKMIFSIHPVSRTPPQIADNLFNCSVPFYDTFKEHLHCNLKQECVGGLDEGGHCSFSSAGCQGNFAADNKCYFHVRANRTLRWTQARRECQKRGGDLAVLKTLDQWKAFTAMLKLLNVMDSCYVGMQSFQPSMPAMYRNSHMWVDNTANYRYGTRTRLFKTFYDHICFFYFPRESEHFKNWLCYVSCETSTFKDFVCQTEPSNATTDSPIAPLRLSAATSNVTTKQSLVTCPGGHMTHYFLACDSRSHCQTTDFVSQCSSFSNSNTAVGKSDAVYMFRCDDERETLHYTLVCDFRQDCADGSDEDFCVHNYPCIEFSCQNSQCVSKDKQCNVALDCWDGSDETCSVYYFTRESMTTYIPPPAIINFHDNGSFTQTEITGCDACPDTHFCCPEAYCMPVYCRCNGVGDCLGKEDEDGCQDFQCPGFYRCRSSQVCLHAQHLCDGWPQCPQGDDEWLCHASCPEGCLCQGHAMRCPGLFSLPALSQLRYLDAADSGTTLSHVNGRHYLIWLNLANCDVQQMIGLNLPNLRSLDLSRNKVNSLNMDIFLSLKSLRVLELSQNPLVFVVSEMSEKQHPCLVSVDLSGNHMATFNSTVLINYPRLQILNLSHSALTQISSHGFKSTPNLVHIDLSGSAINDYPTDVFQPLDRLQVIQAENYKLCCKELLPAGFDDKKCFSPVDEISSCDDLLRSDVYRVFLWLLSVLSVIGNMGCVITRVFLLKSKSLTAFGIFVTNLSIADLFMGVYLALVGAADHVYRGQYFWFEKTWKPSFPCQLAGFLSLLSSETSALTICLITLDRFLVLRFPFSRLHFKRKTATLAALLVWASGLTLAAVPLLPMTSEWEFYSQTGICIPLPITRKSFKGRNYAFGIIIIFNLVLFKLIATGQAMIYLTIRTSSMTTSSTKKTKDLTIARRLLSVVLSDFLCWFPIGLLGIMAANGAPIPGEVNVGMAIFVLPLNAALNPFLYTFNALMERWKKREEQLLLKHLEARSLDLQGK